MATYNKFQIFSENVYEKVHNMGADALRIMLVNSPAPVATNNVKADLTEIAAGNGYVAGGPTPSITSSVHTAGVYKLVLADVTITASGGSIGPFRYAVFWNDTPTSPADPLIAWWDYGSSITLLDGESFTIDMDQVNGVLQHA
jgi:hypothetical protein